MQDFPKKPNFSSLKKITPQELRNKIEEKIKEIRNYTPKVGIFGVTGVGKSALCNALFGKDIAKISDVAACTREPQEIFIGSEGSGIQLVDVPGVGETVERDQEYFELYKRLSTELDLIIWVIKADDRAYTIAEMAYKEILQPNLGKCPVVFVINQVDKLNPIRDWDYENHKPGAKQLLNIDTKILEVSKAFDISVNFIQDISVEEKYNLIDLTNKIVDILPKEKKYSIVREAKEDVKNEDIEIKGEKGIWDSIKEWVGDQWDAVSDIVAEAIASTASNAIKKGWNLIVKKFF